ncbi:hypothetical protein FFWV33_04095 [Flavobacterium faecale]|uniref:Uncharacterized protein n=1 Tax=Flavobacterium faecale TaxID=1355330 RepID=A0A2S1LAN1_9FLAO|nr:hypothetical protein [Flavobacterium faecale]AWG20777.1 hypothetical protein FFWV33_04095 [Flavobacterium faecale]
MFAKYDGEHNGDEPDLRFFTPTYFHRIKLHTVTHSIGGSSPSSEEPSWEGDLLCQLSVDADTLKFKKNFWFGNYGSDSKYFNANGREISKLKYELEHDYHPYSYFTNKQFNFKLFTMDERQLYLITLVN